MVPFKEQVPEKVLKYGTPKPRLRSPEEVGFLGSRQALNRFKSSVGPSCFATWEFPKIKGTCLGVLLTRILLFRVPYY